MRQLVLLLMFTAISLSAQTYEELVKRAEGGDLSVDFREMRFSCLQAKSCDASGHSDAAKDMYKAMQAADYKKAVKFSEQVIAKGFTNIEAHMVCSTAYEKLGDAEKAKFHHDVASGLLRSIFASGDGKTKETAFEVVTTGEEYVVVSVMGLPRFGSQALIAGKPHSYDLQTREDPKSGQKVEIYFKIDAFFPMKGL